MEASVALWLLIVIRNFSICKKKKFIVLNKSKSFVDIKNNEIQVKKMLHTDELGWGKMKKSG